MEILGQRLRQLRTARGITAAQAAREIGMPIYTYVCYEKGLAKRGFDNIIRMAKFYKVSTDYLFGLC